MTDNKIIKIDIDDKREIEGWGSRDQVRDIADRIERMLPGKLKGNDAVAAAQYALATGANIFRGEVYAYESRGKLVFVDGYKILVKWAKSIERYTESYRLLTESERQEHGLEPDTVAYFCFVLREADRTFLLALVKNGAPYGEAYEQIATSAIGVVTKKDMTTKTGGRKPAPTGWTWARVAQKRSLKNTLNLSHGRPDEAERERLARQVDGVDFAITDDHMRDVAHLPANVQSQAAATEARKDHMRRSGRLPETSLENNPMREPEIDLETGEVIPEREFKLIPAKPKQADWWKNEADFNTFMIELPGDAYFNFLEAKGLNGKADLAILGTLDEARQSARAWMNKPF